MSGEPRDRLDRLVAGLARHLPDQLAPILDDPRFADDRAALQRLADPAWRAGGVAALADPEAAWLLDELERRWSAVGTPLPGPSVRIEAPRDAPVGARVPIRLVAEGLEPPIRVAWEGAAGEGFDAVLLVAATGPHPVTARVDARVHGERTLLLLESVVMGLPG